MKGLFNLRPPMPRYSFTWDVSKVLDYLSTLFPLKDLSLKMLTLKLVALLALSSALRAQSLTCLNIENMTLSRNSVSFVVKTLQKTSKLGNVVQNIEINSYHRDNICPVFTLSHYLDRTKDIRLTNIVLISFKTRKSVTTSTIARWLKYILQLSGIDTKQFKAHSYRGASTSAAYKSGISVKDILKTANWKSAKTFHKFYLRTVITDSNVVNTQTSFFNEVYQQQSNL